MKSIAPISLGWATDLGQTHHTNEDSYACFPAPLGPVLLVCDGMGGMGRGDEASALGVRVVVQEVRESASDEATASLIDAMQEADTRIRNTLCAAGSQRPGCTASACYVTDDGCWIAWIGDSPVLHTRGNRVLHRTRDDKLVEDLIDQGQLTRYEAERSSLGSILTKALGGRPPAGSPVLPNRADEAWHPEPGDCIVLCSDGLTDLVSGEEIAALTAEMEPQAAATELVAMANDRGGHDNITVIVARWQGSTDVAMVSNVDLTEQLPGPDETSTLPEGFLAVSDQATPGMADAEDDAAAAGTALGVVSALCAATVLAALALN